MYSFVKLKYPDASCILAPSSAWVKSLFVITLSFVMPNGPICKVGKTRVSGVLLGSLPPFESSPLLSEGKW